MTILFADVSGSTRIAERMEAEEFAELLGALRDVFERVIPHHGGTIVRMDGDGVAAVFGVPEAHEDDGRRAAEAALELHEGARLIGAGKPNGPVIRLHTGIHSGLVLFNPGDLVRGRFEMLGDATNTASRLMAKARADEILVSEATLGPERHFFRTSERKLLKLRGKDEPVPAYRIFAREEVPTRFAARLRRGVAPFVGREDGLAVLETGLARALEGGSALVAITGPPGLGKTRLAVEFLARARLRGCRTYRGDCESYLAPEPLQPFAQIQRAMIAKSDEVSASPAAIAELVSRQAAAGAIVLLIDDWQWADDAAHEQLHRIRALVKHNLLVILAAREIQAGDPALKDALFVRLSPFSGTESAATIRGLLPSSDPFLSTRIHDYSGGNPLIIEELCHSIAQGDVHRPVPDGGAWLDNLIQARFQRLPHDIAGTVQLAAVIGTVVPVWLLDALTGHEHVGTLLGSMAEADFLYPGERPGTLQFKHGLTRDVIYEAVGLHQRRALHLRIAEELRARRAESGDHDVLEALAYHFRSGGDLRSAAHFAELAGDRAKAMSALDRAQEQFCVALRCLDELGADAKTEDAWSRVVQKLGLAAIFDPSHDHLPLFRRAAERAESRGDRAELAWAEHRLGYVHFAAGDRRASIRHCRKALAVATELGAETRCAQIRETLGQALVLAGDYAQALPLLDRAIDARHQASGERRPPIALAYTLAMKGFALADLGQFAASDACFEEATARIHGIDHEVHASVYSNRSATCLWQGRDAEAFHYAQKAAEVAERARARYTYAMSRALAGYARWVLTQDEEAVQSILDATGWLFEDRDGRQYTSFCHGWLADAFVTLGRFDQARIHAARALGRARMLDRVGETMALRAMARAAAAGQGNRPADHYLAMARRSAQSRGSEHEAAANWLCEAQVRAASGDFARAIIPLAQARAAFARLGMRRQQIAAEQLAARSSPSA
jgi:class 3 adenylate cyclase/tetratricopeptide (TPR) repeat protein